MTLFGMLRRYSELGLVYSDARWCYQDRSIKPEIKYSQDFDKKALENYNYITPVNVLFRKSCLKKSALFNENPSLKGLEDWDFFLRFSDHYPFLHIKKVTSEYNVHEKNSFHPTSGCDYNLAFYLVRSQRFRYLFSKFGVSLFDHVDHMYPLYLVQCYLDNGKREEGFEVATKLQDIYKLYAQKNHLVTSLTELLILFSLGISSFMIGCEDKAGFFFNHILTSSGFSGIETQFRGFVGQYVSRTHNRDLKILLTDIFRINKIKA
jgi:hypothetical protein